MKILNIVFGFFLILDLTLSIKAINAVNTFKPCFPYENCTDDGQAECKDLGGKCCGEYCCNILSKYFIPKVGLDLEPNKYAKLRKQAMLAQEEQNDPMPCALLFVGQSDWPPSLQGLSFDLLSLQTNCS